MTQDAQRPHPVLLVQVPGESRKTVSLQEFPFHVGGINTSAHLCLQQLQSEQFIIKKRDKMFIIEVAAQGETAAINGEFFRNAPLKSGDILTAAAIEFTFYEDYAELDANSTTTQWQDNPTTRVAGVIGQSEGFAGEHVKEIATATAMALDAHVAQSVLSCLKQLVQAESPQDFCQLLLRYLELLAPPCSRAAVFSVPETQDNLTLMATKHSGQKGTLTLSQSGMRQVIQQRKSLLLQSSLGQTHNTLTRFIAPLTTGKEVLGVVHIEWENSTPLAPHLDGISQMLKLSVATYESLVLKDAMDQNLLNTVNVIVQAVDAKDTYTRGHSERVSKYSMAAADVLGLSREVKKYLLISSICHDIGKIGITDAVLKKPAMLSAEEYEEIKTHPSIGGRIIDRLPNAKKIISGVVYHHEKWDGTGYPDGLVGEEIPFFARIIAIADAYDAMVSGRSYSGFMQGDDAMSRFREISELFDKEILQAFFTAFDEGRLSVRTDTVVRA